MLDHAQQRLRSFHRLLLLSALPLAVSFCDLPVGADGDLPPPTQFGEWGTAGNDTLEFNHPRGILIRYNQLVYVADWGNQRVQVVAQDGTFQKLIPFATSGTYNLAPDYLAEGPDSSLYVVDHGGFVRKYDRNDELLTEWRTGDPDGGTLPSGSLNGIAVAGSATHSRLGNVRGPVAAAGGASTNLVPGDTLNLEFATTAIPPGHIRDWFLVTKGVYSSIALPASDQPPSTEQNLPTRFALRQNRPNPFRDATEIHFDLPVETTVRLEIFDAQGRLVRTLADGGFPAGFHALGWDHRTDSGRSLGAGVYLYRIQAGAFRDRKKMVLLAR